VTGAAGTRHFEPDGVAFLPVSYRLQGEIARNLSRHRRQTSAASRRGIPGLEVDRALQYIE
jgi:hypothetical protein